MSRTQQKTHFKKSLLYHDEYERNMREAVAEVVEQKSGLVTAAKKHNLSKSALHRKVQKYKATVEEEKTNFNYGRQHGFKCVFNREEEALLTQYLIQASQMCYGLTLNSTRELAYKYAVANDKEVPASWHDRKKAGLDWMHYFRKRNTGLSLRTPEATSLTRATSFNKHNVGLFFNNLRDVMLKYKFLPHQIYNCDETGITNVHKPPKILTSVSQKQVGKVTSAERGTLVTMCATICANGTFIPPYFVFPRKNFKQFMLIGAPPGSDGSAHTSGWMTSENFENYIRHFIKHVRCSKEDPVVLILDNHESHYAVTVLNLCKENGIVLLTLPPHCSHKLQPLDVSCFFPFKNYYNKALDNWMMNHPGTPMSIYDIAGVVSTAFPLAFTPINIIKGFEKTGISPLNSQIFSDSDYMSSSVTDRPQTIPVNEANGNIETHENFQDSLENSSCDAETICPADIPNEIISNKSPSPQPGPSNTKTLITPEAVRPHLKAAERKQSKKGRKKAKSVVLTDTPIKDQIEKEYEERILKRKQNESKRRGIEKVKRKVLNDSSSDSDVDEDIYCDSTDEEEEYEEDFESKPITINDYVLVKYEKKSYVKYFVGHVIQKEKDDYHISFLKRLPSNKFVFPDKCDKDIVSFEDIVMILPNPFKSGSTKRAAGQFSFPVNLDKYNIM